MKKICFFSLALCLLFNSLNGAELKKLWNTKPVLKTPESVNYDPERNVLYVSNINGNPTEKDGNGFISKLSLDGKIIKLKWVTGLNAPKGAAIYDNKLYVSDIDHLIEIDIPSGKILHRYPAPGAVFLNDVTVDAKGNIYISDSSGKNSAIYKFYNGKISRWLKDSEIDKPNGLFLTINGNLLVGSYGKGDLKRINLTTKKITTVAQVGFGIDGLKLDGKGNYLVSDWKGKTAFVTKQGKVELLLDTSSNNINSADIEFIIKKNLLLIPTFFDNRVSAYQLTQ